MGETVNKIPLRSEVAKENTWATEDLYVSDEAWKEDLTKIKDLIPTVESYRGRLGESSKTLLEFLKLNDQIELMADPVVNYAMRKSDEDTKNTTYQGLKDQMMGVLIQLGSVSSYSDPEILAISDETLEKFFNEEEELKVYKRYLNSIRRKRAHILSDAEERIMAAASDIENAGNINELLNDADMTFDSIKNSEGQEVPVTHGSFIPLMKNPDVNVRKAAFESMYKTYNQFKNTSAGLISSQMKQLVFNSNMRHYESPLQAALDRTEVDTAVYHNLIEAVHENMDAMYRYVRLRKKLLGVDELHMYDLYVPIVEKADTKVTYEEAKKNVHDAVKPLGDDYVAILDEGFNNRWIDVYENVGKRSGAYSSGAKKHPYVLLNHTDDIGSEFTLAHEMGHAIHSYLSNRTQPVIDSEYVIFVAEVASTCNEALLMQHLLKTTTDKTERAFLINYFLEQFRTTLYRQTMFAEFELKMSEMALNGESINAETASKVYHDLIDLYFGNDIVHDEYIDLEWARIPHFYYNFYVYQYATGFSAAIALSQKILNEGEEAVKAYKEKFLSAGCSKDPVSILKDAGVDMSTKKPVEEALKLFSSLIDEMEELMK